MEILEKYYKAIQDNARNLDNQIASIKEVNIYLTAAADHYSKAYQLITEGHDPVGKRVKLYQSQAEQYRTLACETAKKYLSSLR